MFHYTVETDKLIEEAVSSLEASLKEEKFGVLWHFDIKETLESKGLEFEQPYRVLEVCNPQEAKNVLEENQMVGYFLPCKMVVYEGAGTTKIGLPSPFTVSALIAAYTEGDEWLHQVREYIDGNIDFVIDFLSREMPKVKVERPAGTYVLWMDFSGYGITQEEVHDRIYNRATCCVRMGRCSVRKATTSRGSAYLPHGPYLKRH